MAKVIKGGTVHLIITRYDKEDKGQKNESSDLFVNPLANDLKPRYYRV